MSVEHEDGRVFIPLYLGFSDLKVLDDILRSIISYLRNNMLTPQTVKRIEKLEVIRAQLLFARKDVGNATLLSRDDIHAVREAMLTFVYVTRRIVPQSSDRDATLKLVNQLRKHLEKQILS